MDNGFVIADTAGKLTCAEHVTARFVSVPDEWAGKAAAWSREGRDVYVRTTA